MTSTASEGNLTIWTVLQSQVNRGPSIELVPYTSGRIQVARLPGKPDSYGRDDLAISSVSPDGRWIVYVYVDRAESDIMMAENFR